MILNLKKLQMAIVLIIGVICHIVWNILHGAFVAHKSISRLSLPYALPTLQALAEYAIRVSFGTALLASIVIVYTTILVILSSGGRRWVTNLGAISSC
jgi:hypothetical protein